MLGEQDARPPGGGASDLDRGLDGLGAAVGGHHRGDAGGCAREQLLGEHAAEQRDAELREVAGARRHHVLHGGDHFWVIAAEREDAVAAEEVEIALTVAVDEVRALATDPCLLETERPQDAAHLRVQIAIV